MSEPADYGWDEFGRPWFCQMCGDKTDPSTRFQKPGGVDLVYGHERCLWPERFPEQYDGPGVTPYPCVHCGSTEPCEHDEVQRNDGDDGAEEVDPWVQDELDRMD